MTPASPEVTALLADRERFEAWLVQLDGKRGQVAPHVYAKVRADYEARLADVAARLAEREGELAAAVEALVARVGALAADLTARRDARAEDELRALVGEYTASEWDARRDDHDAAIAGLEGAHAQAERDLAAARAVLAQATRPSAAPSGASPEAPILGAAERPSVAIEAAVAEPPAAPTAPGGAVKGPPSGEARPPVPPSPAPPPPAPPAAASTGVESLDELAFLTSVLGRATPLGVPRVSGVAAPAPDPPPAPAAGASAPAPTRASHPTLPLSDPPPARGSVPVVPGLDQPMLLEEPRLSGEFAAEPVGRSTPQSAKTLKCSECGTLNYPTEWYCEKCGGELAAL